MLFSKIFMEIDFTHLTKNKPLTTNGKNNPILEIFTLPIQQKMIMKLI